MFSQLNALTKQASTPTAEKHTSTRVTDLCFSMYKKKKKKNTCRR